MTFPDRFKLHLISCAGAILAIALAAGTAGAQSPAQKRQVQPGAQQAPQAQQQPAPQQGGDTTVKTETTTYDQWTVTCRQGGSGPKTCSAVLRVLQPNQQLVLLWEIARGTDGALRSAMQTPTGVLVQRGVDLKIGDAIVGKLDYVACVPQNCEATGAVDDALGKKLTAAIELTVTIHAKDGRDINFKFPVKGIDKAITAVRS